MITFDEPLLTQRLAALPAQHCLAFMAACCERLVPIYVAFCIAENWGDRALAESTLNEIWERLEGLPITLERCKELSQSLLDVAPNSEDFAYILTESSQDALGCLDFTIRFCATGDRSLVIGAAKSARNALESYLSSANQAYVTFDRPEWLKRLARQNQNLALQEERRLQLEFDAWIETTPLMQAELAKQEEDLAFLEATPLLDAQALKQLRDSSRGCGLRPLERGLVPGEEARRLLRQETKRP